MLVRESLSDVFKPKDWSEIEAGIIEAINSDLEQFNNEQNNTIHFAELKQYDYLPNKALDYIVSRFDDPLMLMRFAYKTNQEQIIRYLIKNKMLPSFKYDQIGSFGTLARSKTPPLEMVGVTRYKPYVDRPKDNFKTIFKDANGKKFSTQYVLGYFSPYNNKS